ncbi:MAG: hypothetical protein RH982_04815 [Parvibaculum sp.]
MRPELQTAIAALEEELTDIERQATELRNTINVLCRRAGLPLRYADTSPATQGSALATQIKSDTFYGKKMQTAAREFLEMRKRADLGPAKPREIYEALQTGGFQFEAKDETTALVGVRATLRKNSATFHKLPNGEYGLRAWYPNAKPSKADDDADEDDDVGVSSKATKARKKPVRKTGKKGAPRKSGVEASAPQRDNPYKNLAVALLRGGAELTLAELAQAAELEKLDPGGSMKRTMHSTMLGLKSQKLAEMHEGKWRLIKRADAQAAE